MIYDVIIIGGGPSALSAGLYLGRYRKKTLLVTDSFGGLALNAGEIENYPGYTKIAGFELIQKMIEQIKSLEDIEIREGETVTSVIKNRGGFTIKTDSKEYQSLCVLICAGSKPRTLGFKGEDKLIGRGLSYCATCDSLLAKAKKVIVIGGGRSATEAAITLTNIASKVTIVNINKKLSGEKITLDKLELSKSVNIINNAETTGFILDNNFIKGIKYKDKNNNKTREISGSMVFVEIGQVPNTDNFKNIVKVNEKGEIKINQKTNETSVRGIYSSGDITDIKFKQIIIAAGEGAKAAMSINQYLGNNLARLNAK